jgi:hypothetical protein
MNIIFDEPITQYVYLGKDKNPLKLNSLVVWDNGKFRSKVMMLVDLYSDKKHQPMGVCMSYGVKIDDNVSSYVPLGNRVHFPASQLMCVPDPMSAIGKTEFTEEDFSKAVEGLA